jgi:pimeloyl-ACP methyl ester carboxylesterase
MKKALKIVLITLPILIICVLSYGYYSITYRIKGSYFNSNGVRIHYTIEGKGEPVILIHGFAVNPDLNFRREGITKALSNKYQVISLDLRGHGLSGKPHDPKQYGLEMGEDVIRLMDHLKIRKAHVAGYSLGGFITLKLATTHPDRLITAGILGSGWESPDNSAFLKALPKLGDDLKSGKAIGPLVSAIGPERKNPGMFHTLWVKLMTGYFNDKEAIIAMLPGLPEYAITEQDIRRIHVPLCGIVGSEDPFIVSSNALKGVAPDYTQTVIEGADHMRAPMRKEFVTALMSFLNSHKSDSDN